MKLCVIVPTEEHMAQAGVRIRYERLREPFARYGCEIDMVAIDSMQNMGMLVHDAYLFSKCYDARVFLLAGVMRRLGKPVGIDFFDDYFSQTWESKFLRQREWLLTVAAQADFYLCSTQRMQQVVESYMPGVPSHIMNDPFDDFPVAHLAERLHDKRQEVANSRQLDVAWFGVGDNPHFLVGLHDLHAWSYTLHALAGAHFDVRLHILTNKRALTSRGLDLINRLPVATTVEEWSVEKESALLDKCLVAFIPVNGQQFSIAKSMNRAVTALTAGAQVLSPGYPLYRDLADFIYRDSDALLKDLVDDNLLLRPDTLGTLETKFNHCANLDTEACNAAMFFKSVKSGHLNGKGRDIVAIVHGVRSPAEFHKHIQKLGQMSVSSPFGVEKLNYDVRFVPDSDEEGMMIEVEKRLLPLMAEKYRNASKPATSCTGRAVVSFGIDDGFAADKRLLSDAFAAKSRAMKLVTYPAAMQAITRIVRSVFPTAQAYVSERELPYYSVVGESP